MALEAEGSAPPSIALYGAVNHASNNNDAQGGTADFRKRLLSRGLTVASQIELVSTSILDIDQIYLVEGISTSRIVESELIAINGTEAIKSINSYFRINKVEKQTSPALNGKLLIRQVGFMEMQVVIFL